MSYAFAHHLRSRGLALVIELEGIRRSIVQYFSVIVFSLTKQYSSNVIQLQRYAQTTQQKFIGILNAFDVKPLVRPDRPRQSG